MHWKFFFFFMYFEDFIRGEVMSYMRVINNTVGMELSRTSSRVVIKIIEAVLRFQRKKKTKKKKYLKQKQVKERD